MDKDDEIKKRISDLARMCFSQGRYTCTGFLTLADQAAFFEIEKELSYLPYELFGGTPFCERKMLRFGSEDMLGYRESFPISCIKASPSAPKFADRLSHRDFLGALLNLGINRDRLGDIIVRDNCACIFCEKALSSFICGSLDRVKHTIISCEITEDVPEDALPLFSDEEYIADSMRCDTVISRVYKLSRSKSSALFGEKKVFLNGRQLENTSRSLERGDTVSVRGFGKFIFCGTVSETRKNRSRFLIKRYI